MYAPEERPETVVRSGSSRNAGNEAAAACVPVAEASAMLIHARAARVAAGLVGPRMRAASEAQGGAERDLARRAVEAGQHAVGRDVVARGAIGLVGQVAALQRQRPGIVQGPDHARTEQAVALLADRRAEVGGRPDLALVGV